MKKILLIIAIITGHVYSQNYWGEVVGGSLTDETFAVEIDYNNGNNSVEVGYFTGASNFHGTNFSSSGFTDIFITKHAPDGSFLWAKQFGGAGEERAVSVSLDASGNIYITGHFWGSFEFDGTTYTSFGQEDAFVAKLDANGNPLWFVQEGGASSDLSFSCEADVQGNVVITGEFNGTSTFGSTVLTAVQEDVFIAKYNGSTGNLLWVQQGTADLADRGISICTDENANVYVTGQFSDTITFDVTHNYNLYNGVYVIKLDGSGNEQWFRVIAGGLTNIAYDISSDNNGNVYLTGDFTGGLQFLSPINYTLTNPHYYKVFVAKLTTAGNLVWAKADGSDNEVTSRAIDVKGNKVGITGQFKCTFDEYSDIYGGGIFNSMGYWDCFTTSYDINGNREWARQWASTKNDKATGIAIDPNGVFLLSGSSTSYLYVPTPVNPTPNWHVTIPNCGTPNYYYCGQAVYSYYYMFTFGGTSDGFAGKLIDPAREPFDYYSRTAPGCTKPFVPGCITTSTPLNPYTGNCAPDSVKFCENATLHANTNTSPEYVCGVGPNYIYDWSNGDHYSSIYVNATGNYSVTITTEDGCYTSNDDLFVIIYQNPPPPLITDDIVINDHEISPQSIEVCTPVNILLTGTPVGDMAQYADYYWSFGSSFDTTYLVTTGGSYGFAVFDTNGCYNANGILITVHDQYPLIDPTLVCSNDLDLNDSVDICEGNTIQYQVIDLFTNSGCIIDLHAVCSINDSMYVTGFLNSMSGSPCSYFYFTPTIDDTIYTVSCHLTQTNICDTTEYFVYDTLFVNIFPNPIAIVDLDGPTAFCNGDSALFTATGNSTIVWGYYAESGIYFNGVDSLIVNDDTYISVSVNLIDSNGCQSYANDYIYISSPSPPFIYTNPSNGLICPNDSVQLYFLLTNYVNYTWYGPGLPTFPNSPSVYTSVPGLYYCSVIDTNGCELLSNVVEVFEYTTPTIYATPDYMLCGINDSVTINVTTNIDAVINWINPAWGGSSPSVIVNQPGVYTCEILSCGILTISSATIEMDTNNANVILTADPVFCENSDYLLSATPGYLNYLWQPCNLLGEQVTVTTGGNYFVIVTDEFGCQISSDTVSLFSYPTTAEDPDTTSAYFCIPDIALLYANATGVVNWYDSPTSTTIIHTGTNFTTPLLNSTTIYYVENINDSCTSNRLPVYAVAIDCDSLTVPNVFTPNGDGLNDGVHFYALGATCLNVVIYDRWGLEIFASDENGAVWNGKTGNGDPLSDGVYFYIVNYCPHNGPNKTLNGFIHLFN